MRELKQNTATNIMAFMTDSSDRNTGKPGCTLIIDLSKNGGVFNPITPTVTDRGNGWYNIELTDIHTDTLGDLALHITGSGADPSDIIMRVTAAVAWIELIYGITSKKLLTKSFWMSLK